MTTLRWPGVLFALTGILGAASAFIGFDASSFWIDELFTLHVVDHDGGFGEVWRRALTDVHPPFYYLFMYAWTRIAGLSEFAVRLPSALLAVSALGVFAFAARRVASRSAIAFAVAVAVLSSFWFDQSQNARNYGLCMLVAASLFALALRVRRLLRENPEAWPVGSLAAIGIVGLAGSLTHSYQLLMLGMLLLHLLLTGKNARTRLAVIAIGLVVLALNIAYLRSLTQNTALEFDALWFRNDAKFFIRHTRIAIDQFLSLPVIAALLALGAAAWFTRGQRAVRDDIEDIDARWTVRLAGLVLLGTWASGIAVSLLVTPSFSYRNLLVTAPFAWFLLARLYDVAGPHLPTRRNAVFALTLVLLVASNLVILQGRWLPRNQEWRASADFLRENPQCAGKALPVVFPHNFGPATPSLRDLASRDFFGRYASFGGTLSPYLATEFARPVNGASADDTLEAQIRRNVEDGCRVIAWGVHDLDEKSAIRIAAELVERPSIAPRSVTIKEFDHFEYRRNRWRRKTGAYVFLLGPDPAAGDSAFVMRTPAASPAFPGDEIIVEKIDRDSMRQASFYREGYSVKRWSSFAAEKDFAGIQRMDCGVFPDMTAGGAVPQTAICRNGEVGGGFVSLSHAMSQ